MILTFKNLNIPISAAQTEGPCKVLQFMGIILDSHKMEGRLPVDRVERIKTTLCEFRSNRSTTLQELQSLISTSNFACKVIPMGPPFLQRMIALTKVLKNHPHIKLTTGFFKEPDSWSLFIEQWNGIGLCLSPLWDTSETLSLFTDVSGPIGYGGFFQTTVRPLLSGHPPFSGHFPKSRFICQLTAVFDTSIQRSPLLSGRGHLFAVTSVLFMFFLPPLSGQLIIFLSIDRLF